MISIIIPAYNEEKYLPATLAAVRRALGGRESFEIIVVDNNSTDNTCEVAFRLGARVVGERERNISTVRNTGGDAANGEVLVFIDADTAVRPGLFEKIEDAMEDTPCVGGSVDVEFETFAHRKWMRYYLLLAQAVARGLGWRQGALQFCRSSVFRELDGYDETIFLGEDIEFHWRLDKLAKNRGGHTAFIEEPKVLTSSRRFEQMSLIRMLILTHPITIFLAWRSPTRWTDWYDNAVR